MKRIAELAEKKTLRVVGLMSGTSADGVDVAVVDLRSTRRNPAKVLAFKTFPYPPAVRKEVLELCSGNAVRVENVCHLNFVLGELFADAAIRLSKKARIDLASIDLIGSHGQTICHLPNGRSGRWNPSVGIRRGVRSTLQIGEPSVIAGRTGITTVADFRPRDIVAGGQGAPLVPCADYFLFAHPTRTRSVQNIGGIANVTYLPADGSLEDVIAFDTGPGNMILDRIATRITRGKQTCDRNGRLAAKGCVNELMLAELMANRYLRRRPPKSTGREEFGWAFADALYARARRRRISPPDIVATVTAFTAASISDAYRRFLPADPDEVILCGGGARNRTLVKMLRGELPSAKVLASDDFGISVDAKEAVSFAILAARTIRGQAGNVPGATGADRQAVLGKIIPGAG